MADQDDFTFDEQDSDSEEWYEEEPEIKKKGGSRSRVLFLLLLLVALAGGGYYYTMMPMDDDGPAAPTKKVVKLKKKSVAMPAKPQVIKPAPVKKSAEVTPQEVVQSAPAPVTPPDKFAKKPQPMPTAKDPAPVPAASKPEDKVTKVFETSSMSKPAKVAMPAKGPYTLTVGTYLLQTSVDGVTKKIRSVGYEPVISPVKRKVTMTRLKVGTYSKAEAAAKIAELKSIAPGVFGIQKGDRESVYVGSYLVLDKARQFADFLYKKGIKLEEEPVQVEKTLQRVTFGSFANPDAAKEVARQAAITGVEAKVYKNR